MPDTNTESNERILTLIAGSLAVMSVVAFTLVGELALENVAYGAIAGLFAGVGSCLFLPWFLHVSNTMEHSEELGFSEASRQVDGSAQLGVLGLGLELAGVLMLAAGFALPAPDVLLGGGLALAVALVVSLAGSLFLD